MNTRISLLVIAFAITVVNAKQMFGYYDGDGKNSLQYAQALGHIPAVKMDYFNIDENGIGEMSRLNDLVTDIHDNLPGCELVLTLQPILGYAHISDAGNMKAAQAIAGLRKKLGRTIYVRYGTEMNGNWHMYGQQPPAYIAAYNAFGKAVRKFNKNPQEVPLVWSPNVQWNGIPTDYDAFYPDDKYVDWVGLSLFTPVDAITPLSPDNFQIRLEQPNNQDFYSLYAVAKNKPMMLETGAPYPTTGADPAGELPFKMSWAEQIFAERTVARMPLMKMVMWLETTKNNAHVPYNFGIMHTPALLTAFNKLMVPSVVQFSSAALSSMPVKTGASKSHIMGQSSSSPPQMNNSSAGLSRQAAASSAGPSSASASKCPTY